MQVGFWLFNFKLLATFEDSMERKYVLILESLFMVLFCTLTIPPPGGTTAYCLVEEILNAFESISPLMGSNMVWSVNQAFLNPFAS